MIEAKASGKVFGRAVLNQMAKVEFLFILMVSFKIGSDSLTEKQQVNNV